MLKTFQHCEGSSRPTVAATAAAFEVPAAVADVGRLAATVIVVVVDGKAISAFPDKIIQKLFALLRAARRARPSTLARYSTGRVFWMARTRDRSLFVSR